MSYVRARNAALGFVGVLVLGATGTILYIGYVGLNTQLGDLTARIEANTERIESTHRILSLLAEDNRELESALEAERQRLAQVESESAQRRAALSSQLSTLESELGTQRELFARADIAGLVAAWSPRVAQIECAFIADDKSVKTVGSAVATSRADRPTFITNRHVLTAGNEAVPRQCRVRLLAQGVGYVVDGDAAQISTTRDIGYLPLKGIDDLPDALDSEVRICETTAEIGDQVIILGYPRVGAQSGITATDGIIAGIEDDYYVTNAKIEQGNSGGAAIHVANSCLLGIPTLVLAGKVESLARILPLAAE